MEQKLPLPPFTLKSALQKIQIAEDVWNSRDPDRVSKGYTIDSEWRNRNVFLKGREAIVFRAYANENWEYDENGLMQRR